MWPGRNTGICSIFSWFALMSGFLSRLLVQSIHGVERWKLKKNNKGMQAVLIPKGLVRELFPNGKKRWLNKKPFRSTFNHTLSFLRNYASWVPRSGEETMGQIKHLSPLFTCTQCALWELVLYVLFHRWEWVISLRNECSGEDWARV